MPFGDHNNGGGRSKTKIALMVTGTLVVVAFLVVVAVGFTRNQANGSSENAPSGNTPAAGPPAPGHVSTSNKAIQTICQPTDYREECVKSLSAAAGNASDPKDLIKAAFTVAVDQISAAVKNSSTLKELAKDSRTNQALANCDELLDYATDDLRESFDRIGAFEVSKLDDYAADLKTWLSAAVTYQQTCLDGFENTTGDAGEKMKSILKSSQQLTSNGLAMVTEFASLLSTFDLPEFNLTATVTGAQRRLLEESEGTPKWAEKRLLAAVSKPDVVVAQDGTGKYKTVNEALKDVPLKNTKSFVIYIKQGIYKEHVVVPKTMTHVTFVGDGPTKTRITGSLNFVDGIQTFKTATVSVIGSNFMARDIGFENTAGAAKHQAVALRVQSDQSVFYNIHVDGHQDSLYTHAHRQFYRDCTISGTIDFIFGDAAAVFQNCKMVIRRPMDNQFCIVTAQGRSDRRQATALILQNCTISGDPLYIPFKTKNKAYLGRPWKEYSRTIIMNSQIDAVIAPEGWLPWAGTFAINTCFYSEISNRGPGSDLSRRVKWPGIKKIDASRAGEFGAARFLGGDLWIKASGVPYSPAGGVNV